MAKKKTPQKVTKQKVKSKRVKIRIVKVQVVERVAEVAPKKKPGTSGTGPRLF